MFTSSLPRVNVVGANAHGYTTAILLLLQGYKVTMIAEKFPSDAASFDYSSDDTTSQWQTNASLSETSLQEYDMTSFNMFLKLAKCKAKESGIRIGSSFKYYQSPTVDQSNPWWKHIVPGFQMIPKQDLPKDIQVGYHYTNVMINPTRFLVWLQIQFLALGGKQRKVKLDTLLDAIQEHDHTNVIVNCSDRLHLSAPASSPSLIEVQQQQWVIKASQIRKSIHVKTEEEDLYAYPRMDGTVVIGSRHQQQTQGVTHNARDVLLRLAEYCPELTWGKGIDAIKVISQETKSKWVHPQGPRIENQFTVTPLGRKIVVTHNNRHDGYQSTWGSAKRTVQLVKEASAVLKKESESVSELLSRL